LVNQSAVSLKDNANGFNHIEGYGVKTLCSHLYAGSICYCTTNYNRTNEQTQYSVIYFVLIIY